MQETTQKFTEQERNEVLSDKTLTGRGYLLSTVVSADMLVEIATLAKRSELSRSALVRTLLRKALDNK